MSAEAAGHSLRTVAVVAGALIALGAALLWVRYGGAVFSEMLASAWALCF